MALMGGKKVKGRKRHIATDTCGHLLTIKVHAANIHDTMSGCHVFRAAQNKYPTIQAGCGDEGYRGTFVDFCNANSIKIDISNKIKDGWHVLAKIVQNAGAILVALFYSSRIRHRGVRRRLCRRATLLRDRIVSRTPD